MSSSNIVGEAFVEKFDLKPTSSGPLDNLRFAVKDFIDIKGHITAAGNPHWEKSHFPSLVNAVCVDQLLQLGAHCVGKTITDELGFSLDGENFFYGTPLNPQAPLRIPGGSSSGSASAVAQGQVDFALGTDTGGSIRVPASNCGIYGFRPSHGFISLAGIFQFAPSFDTVGILAADMRILIKVAEGLLGIPFSKTQEIGAIYLIDEAFEIVDKSMKTHFLSHQARLKELYPNKVHSLSIREVDREVGAKGLDPWLETFSTIQWAEIWSMLGNWIEKENPDFGPRTKANFLLTKNLNRETLQKTVEKRELFFRSLLNYLKPQDLICMPTTGMLPPLKGALAIEREEDEYYYRTLSLNSIAGIGRLPQISLPFGSHEGISTGLSFLGRFGEDDHLLRSIHDLLEKRGTI